MEFNSLRLYAKQDRMYIIINQLFIRSDGCCKYIPVQEPSEKYEIIFVQYMIWFLFPNFKAYKLKQILTKE